MAGLRLPTDVFVSILKGTMPGFLTLEEGTKIVDAKRFRINENVVVDNLNENNYKILLSNSTFEGTFLLNELYISEITFHSVVFLNNFEIKGGNIGKINIINCSMQNVNLDTFHTKKLLIDNTTCQHSFTIKHNDKLDNCSIRLSRAEELTIEGGQYETLLIENCSYSNSLNIVKGDFFTVDIKKTFAENAQIIESVFHKTFTLEDCERFWGLYISRVNFEEEFIIKNVNIEVNSLTIASGDFKKISLLNVNSGQDVELSGGTIQEIMIANGNYQTLNIGKVSTEKIRILAIKADRININNADLNNVELSNSAINWIEIYESNFKNSFSILENCVFEEFKIKSGDFDSLDIVGGLYNQKLILEKGKFNIISVTGIACIEELTIHSQVTYQTLRIQSWDNEMRQGYNISDKYTFPVINKLVLEKLRLLKDVSTTFEDIAIYSINFNSVLNNGVFNMMDVKASPKYTFSVNDQERLPILDEINPNSIKPLFLLHNSDLGKAVFINCDLSDFNLDFKSSKLTDVFISGTQMPSELEGDNIQKRLGHSQLKKIYENRGDSIEANQYFAHEMNAYYGSLRWNWKNGWKNGNNSEVVNLYLNKLSSNHGQSWQQGFIFLLGISLFFYLPFCLSIGYKFVDITINSIFEFLKLSVLLLEFINPIHRIESFDILEKEIRDNNSARIIDAVSRIPIAYAVYQFVQAFRKHGKK